MVDKWTNPTTANLRGENSLPLQQTFSSLSTYLGKLDDAITAAAASGVSSIAAGSGISVSAGTGAVTVANTGVTSVAGTANQITASASTGAVTVSLPSNVTVSGKVYSQSGNVWIGDSVWEEDAAWQGVGSNTGNRLLLRHTSGNNIYLISRVGGTIYLRPGGASAGDYAFNDSTLNTGSKTVTIGNHTLSSDTWRLTVTPNNYSTLKVTIGEYYGQASVRATSGTLYLVSTGDLWFGIDNNNRFGYWNTNGIYLEQGWFRPHGSNGIYFQSYGGGWNMEDTTWIRAYGSKNIYTPGEIRSNNPFSSNNTNNGANLRMISGNFTYFGWFGYYAQYVDSTHVKTFVIDHPTKSENYLVHACAEGPTSDVFYRGEAELKNGICVVELPDYFEELTEQHGRTVMVTPIADENGPVANLAAHEIHDGQFLVEQIGGYHVPYQKFWWRVDAIRKNTEFDVEPSKATNEVGGDGPYTYIKKRIA